MRHTAFLGHAQEFTLSGLLRPVVAAVGLQETLRAGATTDLCLAPLLTTARSEVEAPKRQTDAPRLSFVVVLQGKEPVGNPCFFLFFLPRADVLHRPGIRGTEVLDGLSGLIRLDDVVLRCTSHHDGC